MMSGNLNDSRAHIMIIHASNEGAYIWHNTVLVSAMGYEWQKTGRHKQ
jgi:hypothetical protein